MRVWYFLQFVTTSVLLSKILVGKAQQVTLYEHTGRGGRSIRIDARRKTCVPLPRWWYQRASSLSSHGSCIVAFENRDCTGRFIRLRPGTATYVANLKKVKFNDVITSVKSCELKNQLNSGRYAIQNVEDKMYLTARHVIKGYTMVETEKWTKKISQQWDVEKTRDGTYWLIPRVHVSQNHLTYDMKRLKKDDFPEIGMFRERVYWELENVKQNRYLIKNDDTGLCLTRPDDSEIEEEDCDRDSKNQQWLFYHVI